jgi:hypothetical protein
VKKFFTLRPKATAPSRTLVRPSWPRVRPPARFLDLLSRRLGATGDGLADALGRVGDATTDLPGATLDLLRALLDLTVVRGRSGRGQCGRAGQKRQGQQGDHHACWQAHRLPPVDVTMERFTAT